MAPRPPSSFRTIVFGVVSGAPNARDDLQVICTAVAAATGRIVIPQLFRTYAALSGELARGMVHLAWAPPVLAVEVERAGTARAVLCTSRAGRTSYHAGIFVRRGAPARTLGDLAGKHMGWVDRQSSAGYIVPRLRISAEGLDPGAHFARESFFLTHARVARAVLDGEVDAGAACVSLEPQTGRVVAAAWIEAGAEADAVHLIASAGPISSDAIVVSTRLAAELAAELVSALRGLPRSAPDAVRGLLRADGFEPVQPAHFEELRRLMAYGRSSPSSR